MSVRILTGDCRELLATLEPESVQTCVTSPPYFGLRDYGVAGQIGLEPTPDAFVAELVAVFREVRRVLRNDGTLWLNLGDSYNSAPVGRFNGGGFTDASAQQGGRDLSGVATSGQLNKLVASGLPPKNLLGIPWRVAFALQSDGWYLRSDIIWHKPNPMPESVTDRPTKAHEYLFLLAKSERYLYDAEAIAEEAIKGDAGSEFHTGKTGEHQLGRASVAPRRPQLARAQEIFREKGLTAAHLDAIRAAGITDAGKSQITQSGTGKNTADVQRLAAEAKEALGGYYREFTFCGKRNRRTVWTVATQPFKGSHFATFPPALIEPCILAGSKRGDVVLDPFGGAGTTGLVADRLGRDAVLCELNPQYAAMARARIHDDAPLFADGAA